MRPRWLIDLHPDFPSAEQVAQRLGDPIIVTQAAAGRFDWPAIEGPLVLYGTMRMVAAARREPRIAPWVLDDYAALRCSSYYRWIYERLGRTSLIVPLSALPHVDWAHLLGERVFIRPDSNFKLFSARIVAADAMRDFVAAEHVHRDELVVVSNVVELGPEYRCICGGGRIIAHSAYPEPPFAPAPPAVLAFAAEVCAELEDTLGAPLFTVDVAVGADRLRVVEIGGVNSWGLYGADAGAFIAAMEAAALARDAELRG